MRPAVVRSAPQMAASAPARVVVWFRNDLRLHDNPLLERARTCGASEVVPCYIFDPRTYAESKFGSPKTAAHRARFIHQSVSDLCSRLSGVGSGLLIGVGRPEDLLPSLCHVDGGTTFMWQEQRTTEELRVESAVRAALAQASTDTSVHTSLSGELLERADLPFGIRDMPNVFTPWRNAVEKACTPPKPLSPPAKGSLPLPPNTADLATAAWVGWEGLPESGPYHPCKNADEPSENADAPTGVLDFVGGETSALNRVQHYIWDADCLKDYFTTRNGMHAAWQSP